LNGFSSDCPVLFESLRAIYKEFSSEDAKAIKQIEQTTNHDVKAVEYFIKAQYQSLQRIYSFWIDLPRHQQHRHSIEYQTCQ
jgi:hypothetical protein